MSPTCIVEMKPLQSSVPLPSVYGDHHPQSQTTGQVDESVVCLYRADVIRQEPECLSETIFERGRRLASGPPTSVCLSQVANTGGFESSRPNIISLSLCDIFGRITKKTPASLTCSPVNAYQFRSQRRRYGT
jgi:hypothetical protein